MSFFILGITQLFLSLAQSVNAEVLLSYKLLLILVIVITFLCFDERDGEKQFDQQSESESPWHQEQQSQQKLQQHHDRQAQQLPKQAQRSLEYLDSQRCIGGDYVDLSVGGGGLVPGPPRSYPPCGFCKREFLSAQALGGLMRTFTGEIGLG